MPISITKRTSLARNLTAAEVDANFQAIADAINVDPVAIDFSEEVPLDTSGFGKMMAVKVQTGNLTLVPLAAGKIELGFCVVRIVSDGVSTINLSAFRQVGAVPIVPEANRRFLLTCVRRFDEDMVFVEKLGLTTGSEPGDGGVTGGGGGSGIWTAEDTFQREDERPLFTSSSGNLWVRIMGNSSDWPLSVVNHGAVSDGAYKEAGYGFETPSDATHILAVATFTNLQGGGKEGILFRGHSSESQYTYCTFSRADGNWNLLKRVSATTYNITAAIPAPNWGGDGLTHTYSVECFADGRILCKADGVTIFDVVDTQNQGLPLFGIDLDGSANCNHFKVTAE